MKTANLLKILPACAAVLALGGCGGGGDDAPGASITACFTADKTVNFKVASSSTSSNTLRSTTGPMFYYDQAVTGQTFFDQIDVVDGIPGPRNITYWSVTSTGVIILAHVIVADRGMVLKENTFFPRNMAPGQTVTGSEGSRYTLVGFETVSLAGKTFYNTCRISGGPDTWYAPGYGVIKEVYSDRSYHQYNGDL